MTSHPGLRALWLFVAPPGVLERDAWDREHLGDRLPETEWPGYALRCCRQGWLPFPGSVSGAEAHLSGGWNAAALSGHPRDGGAGADVLVTDEYHAEDGNRFAVQPGALFISARANGSAQRIADPGYRDAQVPVCCSLSEHNGCVWNNSAWLKGRYAPAGRVCTHQVWRHTPRLATDLDPMHAVCRSVCYKRWQDTWHMACQAASETRSPNAAARELSCARLPGTSRQSSHHRLPTRFVLGPGSVQERESHP
jgi:hypothetical protein